MPGYIAHAPPAVQLDRAMPSPPTVKRIKQTPLPLSQQRSMDASIPSHPPPPYALAIQHINSNLRAQSGSGYAYHTSPSEVVAERRRSKRNSRDAGGRIQKLGKRHKPTLSINTDMARRGVAVPKKAFVTTQERTGTLRRVVDRSRNLRLDASRSDSSVSDRRQGYEIIGKDCPERIADRQQKAENSVQAIAPTILITKSRDRSGATRPRVHVPSSVYSQASHGPPSAGNTSTTIPLRILQSDAKCLYRDSVVTDFEEDDEPVRAERITSTMTVFEEDQLDSSKSDRMTDETPVAPTPHRSKGWWTVITTPFEASKQFTAAKGTAEIGNAPEVPALPPFVFMPASQPGKELRELRHNLSGRWGSGVVLSRSEQTLQTKPRRQSSITSAASTLEIGEDTTDTAQLHRSDARQAPRDEARNDTHVSVPPSTSPRNGGTVSRFSEFSPDDREVPVLLGLDVQLPPLPAYSERQSHERQPDPSNVGVALTHDHAMPSPASTVETNTTGSHGSDFSPIVQIAATGAVINARPFLSNPQTTASVQNVAAVPVQHSPDPVASMRSSHIAQIQQPTPYIPQLTAHVTQRATTPGSPTSPNADTPVIPFRPDDWRSPFFRQTASPGTTAARGPQQKRYVNFEPTIADDEKTQYKGKKKYLCFGQRREKKKWSKTRKCCCCCLCLLIILLAIAIAIPVAIVLSRHHNNSSHSIWVNITNYPPVPTGILTVARPNLVSNDSGCVNPSAMWSCAVPKEQQSVIVPNDPDQPNFVIAIRYEPTNSSSVQNHVFQPAPQPPTVEEQTFLGNTTDHNAEPFAGENTPFIISFNPPTNAGGSSSKMRILKRQGSALSSAAGSATTTASGSTSFGTNTIPNLATAIPIPETNPDGTAEPANLLPFPVYQPLRLYNRGLDNEHYGFYTYFERSIFLRSITIQNTTEQAQGNIPADADGGSAEMGATAVCTWRDTRFLVQIWTRKNSTQLLPKPTGGSPAGSSSTNSSTTFVRPGSFPYPVTITIDRHGGGLSTKMLFCYGMDEREHIDVNSRKFQPEDRASGGSLVNPALGPFTNVNVTIAQGGPGGIDGGSGGCGCQWQNF